MSERFVTVAQTEQLRKMANEKGLGRERFQTKFLDDGTAARVLDAVRDGVSITIGIPIIPPSGGRIHSVRIKVHLDRPWADAINAAGPNTPDDYNVRKFGNLYVPTGKGLMEEDLILLNYPAGDGSWKKALAWAEQIGLRKTDPRRVFAVGESHPNFHHDVGIDPTYVVATEECTFGVNRQACYVNWNGSDRKANLNWVSNFGNANDWFAFRNSFHFSPLSRGVLF